MKWISAFLCLVLLLSTVHATGIPAEEEDFRIERERKEELLAAIYESDITSARLALDLGLISCVELTQYFLERIEAYNDTFNCFITLCDNALEEAAKRDALLRKKGDHAPLLGIPIVVKDNIDYEGYPTTNGYWKYGSKAQESATVVQTLLDAGAVILGKTNMATAAQEAQFTASDAIGETLNAYGTELSAGGSSGGSAAAVSLNFCYAGLGTDTNASLRYPGVLNGCVSMRPTRGLLDREGIIILNHTRDVPGVITRSVADQAIVLGEMAETDYYSNLDAGAFEGKRIGILQELCYSEISYAYRWKSKVDTEIKDAFYDAVEKIRSLGATVIPVSIPNIFSLAESCEYNSSYAMDRYMNKYETLFADRNLDAVIFPTYLHTPDNSLKYKGWSQVSYDAFYSNCSLLSSPLGVPEIAIPIGYHSKGSGIGLEIAALNGQEQLLLNLAYAYTECYETRRIPLETAPGLYANGRSLEELIAENMPLEPSGTPGATDSADTTDPADSEATEPIEDTQSTLSPDTSLVPEETETIEGSDPPNTTDPTDAAENTARGENEETAPSPVPILATMGVIFFPGLIWVGYKYSLSMKRNSDEPQRDKRTGHPHAPKKSVHRKKSKKKGRKKTSVS